MERRSALRDLARGFTEGNEGNEDRQIFVYRLVNFVTFCSKFRMVGLNGWQEGSRLRNYGAR